MGESAEALELGRALNRLQNTNSAVEKKRALISIHEWIESSPDKCLHSGRLTNTISLLCILLTLKTDQSFDAIKF